MTFNELQRRVDKVDGYYKALKTQEKNLTEEITGIKEEIDLLTKCTSVLKHLLDVMVKDEIAKMAGLITYGLKTIFDDQQLSFVPVITKKNDKTNVELKTRKGKVEGEFGTYGGSVAVIESFLLRVLCILKKKHARLLILDETFASVGDIYIPNTSRLISELSRKLGLDVLLVTHQKGFQDNADHIYQVKESSDGLLMELLK